jgi:hypothetical protein
MEVHLLKQSRLEEEETAVRRLHQLKLLWWAL